MICCTDTGYWQRPDDCSSGGRHGRGRCMPWHLPQLSADGSRRLMMRGGSLSSHMQSDGVPAGRGARATDGIAAPTMPTRHQVAGTCPGGAHGCHVMREARQETPATHATHGREQSLPVALQGACLPMLRFLFASGSRCTGACTTCRCRHMGWGGGLSQAQGAPCTGTLH